MADESTVTRGAGFIGYVKKVIDETIFRNAAASLEKIAKEEADGVFQKLRVRIFGWGNDDERISLEDQSLLGQAAVTELNRWLESLDDHWTYRFRIIISGIEDQAKRLVIYKMILDEEPEHRQRQLEQVCQTPEHISKAARWIWARLKQAMADQEARSIVRQIIRETAAEVRQTQPVAGVSQEQIEAGLWARLRDASAEQLVRLDEQCGSWAQNLHQINKGTRERQQNPGRLHSRLFAYFTGR